MGVKSGHARLYYCQLIEIVHSCKGFTLFSIFIRLVSVDLWRLGTFSGAGEVEIHTGIGVHN